MASRGTTNNNSAVFFSLWNSEGAWKFLLREADGQWLSGAPPTTATPQFFCFGIPRVLGNSFLGRLKESGLQARAGRCRGRAPKLKTKMRSESSASKKKVPSCDYRAPPPPKRNEKTFENIAEAACKHISYKSVGHRTACLADIWKSYTDRRLENASGTKRLALSRETFS